MSKRIKLKNLIKEGMAGSVPGSLSTFGAVVSRKPFHTDISLSNIVKEKFGDTLIPFNYISDDLNPFASIPFRKKNSIVFAIEQASCISDDNMDSNIDSRFIL